MNPGAIYYTYSATTKMVVQNHWSNIVGAVKKRLENTN